MSSKERTGRRRRESFALTFSWTRLFFLSFFLLLFCFSFSRFLLSSKGEYGVRYHELVSNPRNPAISAISDDHLRSPLTILQTVFFPDQITIFLKYPPSSPLLTKSNLLCAYKSNSSTTTQPPLHVDCDTDTTRTQIVRCPLPPRGTVPTLRSKTGFGFGFLPPSKIYRWNYLAYDSIIDTDNTTLVFIKGFNLRSDRLSDPSRFTCLFTYESDRLSSDLISIAQEIARCKTPLPVLLHPNPHQIRVSVRLKGRSTLPSVARPITRPEFPPPDPIHEMCVCTMLRNQARFLKEWVLYHSHIGVQRWFLYDNNSDDDIEDVILWLNSRNHNVSRHSWPWIKSQESGFAHCAIRARGHCKWVGFIDVDEFLHFPTSNSSNSLHDVLRNYSKSSNVGEIRTFCYNFGPSGNTKVPSRGVTVGYTCRVKAHERHKSIVRPDAVSETLMNVVHHFRLREGYGYVTQDRPVMVINHYKYQVWEVFREKFYRRVATYVADWREEVNAGSRDRAPGLGTEAVEPGDWADRFCEVVDNRLRDWVLGIFGDGGRKMLPWEGSEV